MMSTSKQPERPGKATISRPMIQERPIFHIRIHWAAQGKILEIGDIVTDPSVIPTGTDPITISTLTSPWNNYFFQQLIPEDSSKEKILMYILVRGKQRSKKH